ncbi:MAG: type II secretion system protein N [Halioglobus sp.]|nr:type II secretion system protein N [Halioglobus sp.]
MTLSRISLALVLALVLVVAVLAAAPARLLHLVLPGEQVVMQGLSGTLWNGRASRCLLRLPPGYLHLGAVEWSLQPLSLLALAPRVQLSSRWGQQRVNGELVFRGATDLDVRELQLSVAADLVRQFAPLAVDGALDVDIGELLLRDGLPHAGQGRLVWQNAGFLSPRGRVPLGSFAVDFSQQPGAALQGEVITLAGPLQADGAVELQGRRYRIDLLLDSEYAMDDQLRQALSLMARPQGDAYRIELDAEF